MKKRNKFWNDENKYPHPFDFPQFSRLDRFISLLHSYFFIRFRLTSIVASVLLYLGCFYFLGYKLKVSANYLVIMPVIVASMGFGLPGGMIGGGLALPLNLFLFYLLGHPEYGPASRPMAEISGLLIGTAMGYLSDFFRKLDYEIIRRKDIEVNLRHTLEDKEMLIQEIHHRVKNNLNVIKSILRLQANRSADPSFISESEKLQQRIYSIALVHDQLYPLELSSMVRLNDYIPALLENIISGYSDIQISVNFNFSRKDLDLYFDMAPPLGLIINEVVTNIIKYAFPGIKKPKIDISLTRDQSLFYLTIQDNGIGFHPEEDNSSGLGLKLIRALSGQLKAEHSFEVNKGTRFLLRMPISS